MLITIVPVVTGTLFAVLKATTTVVPAVRGTTETGAKLVNEEITPPSAGAAKGLLEVSMTLLEAVAIVLTVKPLQREVACMGAPVVRPARVTV
jgi:hypothetical protein